ncbi:MAG: hypothetical protein IKY61_02300 [Thermoguttaceae bacterium]|nr:hypothetical protein [Thermoguttaceae bacterium]
MQRANLSRLNGELAELSKKRDEYAIYNALDDVLTAVKNVVEERKNKYFRLLAEDATTYNNETGVGIPLTEYELRAIASNDAARVLTLFFGAPCYVGGKTNFQGVQQTDFSIFGKFDAISRIELTRSLDVQELFDFAASRNGGNNIGWKVAVRFWIGDKNERFTTGTTAKQIVGEVALKEGRSRYEVRRVRGIDVIDRTGCGTSAAYYIAALQNATFGDDVEFVCRPLNRLKKSAQAARSACDKLVKYGLDSNIENQEEVGELFDKFRALASSLEELHFVDIR